MERRIIIGIPTTGLRPQKRRIVSCTLLLAASAVAACSHVSVVGPDRTLQVAVAEYRVA